MKVKQVVYRVIVLFFVDQIIKVIIDRYFLDIKFDIIPPLFYFKPTFNHEYSWINGLFQLGLGFWANIIIFVFISVFFIALYDFTKTLSNTKLIHITFIFGFAGMLCSLIGTILWNGCLDYIYLKPLFVFDLKDLYVDCFVILFLVCCYKDKRLLSIKTKDFVQHFKNRFKKLKNGT